MTQRVVVTGAAGQLGRQLVMAFEKAGDAVIALDHADLDLADPEAPARLDQLEADLVVNSAAWTDVDGCARDPHRALEINGTGPGRLAAAAAVRAASFVQISTNEVFDGSSTVPYDESAATGPINPYGASKLAGERAVAAANPNHLIVRTAWIFGPGGTNFPSRIVAAAHRALDRGEPLRVVADEYGNPTWAPSLARAIVRAVRADVRGIVHLAGEPAVSRYDWACSVLEGLPALEVVAIPRDQYARASLAPAHAVLSTRHAAAMGLGPMDWRDATRAYAEELLTVTASGS